MKDKINVLFVCMGNICRSPLAHGLFENRIEQAGMTDKVYIDSAGTHAYHVGEQPDPRSQETALTHGFDLNSQRARKVMMSDFDKFDYILAMDRDNHAILSDLCPNEHTQKLKLMLDYAPQLSESEVPDPYYGGASGFEHVYQLIDTAADGLLADIESRIR